MEPMEIGVRALVWSLSQSEPPPPPRGGRRAWARALARLRTRAMAAAGAGLISIGQAALRAALKESPARR